MRQGRLLRFLTVLLVLAGTVVLADEPKPGFVSVAPPSALQQALEGNLKLARSWVEDKDYASAAGTVQGLIALTQLHGMQSSAPEWRERVTAFNEQLTQLAAATRKKDGAACARLLNDLDTQLTAMKKTPPTGVKMVSTSFKPAGSLRIWMLLLEGAYVDAKTEKQPAVLRDHAYAIAEEMSAVEHLRPDAGWRRLSNEVRSQALKTVAVADKGDLDAARRELKAIYVRCEACHHQNKR